MNQEIAHEIDSNNSNTVIEMNKRTNTEKLDRLIEAG
jgi:hypothetical protein